MEQQVVNTAPSEPPPYSADNRQYYYNPNPYAVPQNPAGSPPYPSESPPYPAGSPPYPAGSPPHPAGSPQYPAGSPQYPYQYPGAQYNPRQPVPVLYVQPGQRGAIIYQQQPEGSPNFGALMGLACFVFWFCGIIWGIIAFILASQGQDKLVAGQVEEARRLGHASMRCSIFGIVFGAIVTAVIIGVVASSNYYY